MTPMMTILQPILGILFFFGILYGFSKNRSNIPWKNVVIGFGVQCLLALTLGQSDVAKNIFKTLSLGVEALKEASQAGTSFVFGYLGGGPAPFVPADGLAGNMFIFAFQVLPIIIVFSALSMLLFHWRVVPFVVKNISFVMRHVFNLGGAMGVVTAAKLFLSQLETPLLVRPYLKNFSQSELFMVMTLGMSTTAAAAMPLYAYILGDTIDNPISNIMMASLLSVPGAITLCRVYMPHTGAEAQGDLHTPFEFSNSMDAVAKGTSEGVQIFINIMGILVAFAALVALVNIILGNIVIGGAPLKLELILGWVMSPICWLMGIPTGEIVQTGSLLGTKTILNEVFAFTELAKTAPNLSEKSRLIMMYALCGFANLSSAGMVIGVFGTLIPERRSEVTKMAMHAVFVGTIVTCLSGTLVGLFAK